MSDLTALEGCLAKEELEIEARRIRDQFPETIVSHFRDGNPVKYDIMVSASQPGTILVEEVSQKRIIGVETVGNWNKRYWKEPMRFEIVQLYPMHKLALVECPWLIKRFAGKRKLHALGYVPWKRREDWLGKTTEKDKEYLVKLLRTPNLPLNAVDLRALSILDSLLQNLNGGVESLTFAEYIPRHNRIAITGDYGEIVGFNLEKFRGPVKRLVDTPPEWAAQRLEKLCKGLPLSRAIGLASIVQTKYGKRHIPMIDFRGRKLEVENVIKDLSIPGVLVDSGQSYHFYGYELLDEIGWRAFTEDLRKGFNLGIDNNWASFSLLQGFSMLRLVPGKGKLYQPCIVPEYKSVSPTDKDRTNYLESGMPNLAA